MDNDSFPTGQLGEEGSDLWNDTHSVWFSRISMEDSRNHRNIGDHKDERGSHTSVPLQDEVPYR